MEALLIFSSIFLIITLINNKIMKKDEIERSKSIYPPEIEDIDVNWKWDKIFLYGSLIGIVIGLIGTIRQHCIL